MHITHRKHWLHHIILLSVKKYIKQIWMKKKNENTKYIIFTTSLETIIFRRKVWFFFMAFSSFYNKISGKFTNDNSCFCLLLNDWMDLNLQCFFKQTDLFLKWFQERNYGSSEHLDCWLHYSQKHLYQIYPKARPGASLVFAQIPLCLSD